MRFIKVLFLLTSLFYTYLNAEIIIAYDTKSLGNPKEITPNQRIEINKILNIAKTYNIKVTFKPVPWKRALLLVEKGLIDGVIQASYKTTRAAYAKYPMKNNEIDSSKKLNDGNSYYVYRNINSALRWNGKEFLNGGTVAAMEKYAVIEDLKKHPNIKIKTFLNNSQIVRKLAKEKLDAYAGIAKTTDKLLKKFPSLAKEIVKESIPIRKKDYFLIFSKITYKEKSKDMEKIWDGLKEFNKNNNL